MKKSKIYGKSEIPKHFEWLYPKKPPEMRFPPQITPSQQKSAGLGENFFWYHSEKEQKNQTKPETKKKPKICKK